MSKPKDELEEDFLEVDTPISGQNYVCLSFVSPEKIIKQKDNFFLKHFILDLITNEKKKEWLLKVDPEKITYDQVSSMVDDFRLTNQKKVDDEFNEKVDFQTNVRGVKVRGTYDSLKEARVRAKLLSKKDPLFDVYVGQVGYWLSWNVSNTQGEVEEEYGEKQLNELVKEYHKNKQHRDTMFEEEKRQKLEKARQETELRKKELHEQKILDQEKAPDSGKAMEKINELREIADEKDRAWLDSTSKKFDDLKKQHEQEKIDDPLGNNSGFSDPWMARKMEGETELETVTIGGDKPTETVTHTADDVTSTTTTQNPNLEKVVKDIF